MSTILNNGRTMSKQELNFHFTEFKDLDNSNDLEFLLKSMDLMAELPCIKKIKKQALDKLALKKDDLVLEAGCGLGVDAETMGKLVGKNGKIIAIDASKNMLKEAMDRSTCNNVEYQLGKIGSLNFPNDYFSAAHMERVLVDYSDVNTIVKDLIRVVRPGGRICITDVDPMTIVFSPYNEITEKVLKEIHKCFTNPAMGRQLQTLLINQGLVNVETLVNISSIQDYNLLRSIFKFEQILTTGVSNQSITRNEADLWLTQMEEANKRKTFFYCIMLFTVVGLKP